MAEDVTPAPADEPSEARPGVAEETARTGWYRSPSGYVAHADGPDQRRSFGDLGWAEITEDEAQQIIAKGTQITVDRTDTSGTFDSDAVNKAVRDEGPSRPRRRRNG